jgi:hypothetical protein
MKTKCSFVLILAALLFAIPAHADSIVQISGSFTADSSLDQKFNAVETFTESYELDETNQIDMYGDPIATLVPGSLMFSASGDLGSDFSLSYFSPKTVDWTDAAGDIIQVTFYEDDTNPLPIVGDRAVDFFFSPANTFIGEFYAGPFVTAVPEPATISLLLFGVVGLLQYGSRSRRGRRED